MTRERFMPLLRKLDAPIVGQQIAEARKARGLTPQDIADFWGCSLPAYIAIERGDRLAGPGQIVKLASYLGCAVHELVHPAEPVGGTQMRLHAAAAYERGDIGDCELAHYLHCDIVTAHEIAAVILNGQQVEPDD